MVYLLKMVMFHCYVSSPEGMPLKTEDCLTSEMLPIRCRYFGCGCFSPMKKTFFTLVCRRRSESYATIDISMNPVANKGQSCHCHLGSWQLLLLFFPSLSPPSPAFQNRQMMDAVANFPLKVHNIHDSPPPPPHHHHHHHQTPASSSNTSITIGPRFTSQVHKQSQTSLLAAAQSRAYANGLRSTVRCSPREALPEVLAWHLQMS